MTEQILTSSPPALQKWWRHTWHAYSLSEGSLTINGSTNLEEEIGEEIHQAGRRNHPFREAAGLTG
jgi:hypothetical protein